MSDIRQTVARIKEKYAKEPPPENFPLYGDIIIFKDKANGRRYRGLVIKHADRSLCGSIGNDIWEVQVLTDLQTGQSGQKEDRWNVSQQEIQHVYRMEDIKDE